MPTFNVILAQTVRIYGTVQVQADSMAEAIEKIRADAEADSADQMDDDNSWWDDCHEPDYSSAMDETIVEIEAEDGTVRHGISLTTGEADEQRIMSTEELRAAFEIIGG